MQPRTSVSDERVSDAVAQEVLDVEEVLELISLGRFHYQLLIICGLAFMADAMEITLLSYVAICAGDDWDLSSAQVASISSSVFAGILIGNIFWGPVADAVGRRRGFIIGSTIITVFGVATGFATNYATLLVIRTCLGFGVGGSFISFDILAELLPKSSRGQFLTNINYFWTLGSMLVSALAWILLESAGWHMLAVLTSIPVAVSLVWAVAVMPESPRWLALKGRYTEAEDVLRSAAVINGTTLPHFTLRRETFITVAQEEAASKGVALSDFFERDMLPISIPLFTVWFLFGWTYYGIIFLVSRIYSKSSDDDGDDASEYTCDFEYSDIFYNAASEVIGVALTAVVIDRFGRNRSQTTLYVLSGVFVALLGVKMSDVGVSVVGMLARIGSMGATSVTMVVTPELFPTRMRATGHAVCSSFQRIGGFAAPFLVNSPASLVVVALLLGAGNWMAAVCSYTLPETKDLGLDTFAPRSMSCVSSSEGRSQSDECKKPLLSSSGR